MCESFFATLECELRDRRRFKKQVEASMAPVDFIEGWYNPHRRHSFLNYLSPMNYELRAGSEIKAESHQLSTEPWYFTRHLHLDSSVRWSPS
jgi:putative transposase